MPRKVSDERLLEFIDRYIAEYGYSPTFREIAKDVGLSSASSVEFRLAKLRESGLIVYKDRVARTVRRV